MCARAIAGYFLQRRRLPAVLSYHLGEERTEGRKAFTQTGYLYGPDAQTHDAAWNVHLIVVSSLSLWQRRFLQTEALRMADGDT